MNRKVLVAAVAAAFVAPAAFAQSSVTIGGTINILYDTAKAGGATNNGAAGNNDLKSADRVRDATVPVWFADLPAWARDTPDDEE